MKIYTGKIKAPASKSSSLRALICCCLTKDINSMIIHNISKCSDVLVGIELICSLRGFTYRWSDDDLYMQSKSWDWKYKDSISLDAGESGFLARAFISIGTLFSKEVIISGRRTLMKRNLGIKEFVNKVELTASESILPVKIQGYIKVKEFLVTEKHSSQFLSGLLFTLPLMKEDSLLSIEELVSKPYIDLTLSYLERSGITFSWINRKQLLLRGNQQYKVRELTPESDWSSISYIIALGIMKGDITITNIVDLLFMPDRIILNVLNEIGGDYAFSDANTLRVRRSVIKGFVFDLTSNPDLAPTLVVLAIVATTASSLTSCYRLRDKESDRLQSLIEMLSALKVTYSYSEDTLTIFPSEISGGLVKTYDDHRIAMSALILNVISKEKITIDNYECINKSYPNFLNELKILGVEL